MQLRSLPTLCTARTVAGTSEQGVLHKHSLHAALPALPQRGVTLQRGGGNGGDLALALALPLVALSSILIVGLLLLIRCCCCCCCSLAAATIPPGWGCF